MTEGLWAAVIGVAGTLLNNFGKILDVYDNRVVFTSTN